MSKVIYQKDKYRIIETEDLDIDMDNLKGDCFNLAVKDEMNPGLSDERILELERLFEQRVYDEGVYGYILERWDSNVGMGWTCVESCFGFVGNYENEKHDIVEEFKQGIDQLL